MPPFFTSLSQSRACWSKSGEHGNFEGLGLSESDSEKTGTIAAPHLILKVLFFFLLSLEISKFLYFFSFYIFCPINDGVWHLLIKVGLFFLSCIREVEVWIPDTLAKSLSERLDCIYLPHLRVCVYTTVTMHTSDTSFSYV